MTSCDASFVLQFACRFAPTTLFATIVFRRFTVPLVRAMPPLVVAPVAVLWLIVAFVIVVVELSTRMPPAMPELVFSVSVTFVSVPLPLVQIPAALLAAVLPLIVESVIVQLPPDE